MSGAQHTTTPLELKDRGRDGWALYAPRFGFIAHMGSFDANPEAQAEQEANARRLLLCWSVHDALVAALRSCVMVMERDLAGLQLIQPELAEARAALAKTSGSAS